MADPFITAGNKLKEAESKYPQEEQTPTPCKVQGNFVKVMREAFMIQPREIIVLVSYICRHSEREIELRTWEQVQRENNITRLVQLRGIICLVKMKRHLSFQDTDSTVCQEFTGWLEPRHRARHTSKETVLLHSVEESVAVQQGHEKRELQVKSITRGFKWRRKTLTA